MLSPQGRSKVAEFRCQFAADPPEFRCRRLGQIASKGLIYRSFSPKMGRFSGAESESSLPTGKLAGLDPTRIDRDNAG
jgi:hypothetical protein